MGGAGLSFRKTTGISDLPPPESKPPACFLAELHLIVARVAYKMIMVAPWTKSISTRLHGTPRLPPPAVGQRPHVVRRSREGLAASPIILHAVGTETFFPLGKNVASVSV